MIRTISSLYKTCFSYKCWHIQLEDGHTLHLIPLLLFFGSMLTLGNLFALKGTVEGLEAKVVFFGW